MLKGINVFLVGMMGVGKTTIGQMLAQQLEYRFFDTDILIEKVAGKTINEIFATEGENSFRELETKVLEELTACNRSVIATGGGIVIKRSNWSYLQQGLVIWLNAPVEVLIERLQEDNTRPLLQETNLKIKLETLLEERSQLYNQADLKITIDAAQTPEEITKLIINQIPSVLK